MNVRSFSPLDMHSKAAGQNVICAVTALCHGTVPKLTLFLCQVQPVLLDFGLGG